MIAQRYVSPIVLHHAQLVEMHCCQPESAVGRWGLQEVLSGIATFNRSAGVNQSKWQLKKDFQTNT